MSARRPQQSRGRSTRRKIAVFALQRVLIIPLSLLVLVTASFGLIALIPGDPAIGILGQYATPTAVAQLHHQFGFDKPLAQRYLDYVVSVAHGDLGNTFFGGRSVVEEIATRLPNTIELIILSLFVAVGVGILVGTAGAYFSGRLPDRLSRLLITTFQSIPDFLFGLLLIFCFYYLWRLVPAPVGRLGISDPRPVPITNFILLDALLHGDGAIFVSALGHAILPVVTLGLVYSAYLAKTAHATMASSLASAQVEFARACGLTERQVLWYAFTTARLPILTYGAIPSEHSSAERR